MKKLILLPLLALFAFASCSDDKDNEQENEITKLVKEVKLAWGNGLDIYTFDYDSQDRINKVVWTVSNENGGSPTNYNYSYGNNTITVKRTEVGYEEETAILTFDENGYLIEVEERYGDNIEKYNYTYNDGYLSRVTTAEESLAYKWQNGNLVDSDGDIFTYNSIENKLNVGHNTFIEELYVKGTYFLKIKGISDSRNYPVTSSFGAMGFTYQYEFDEDGYPTKIISTENCTVTFSYY
ncbi:MAG: DUF4595 domain-containing protein [Alistipes sp.]|nr:DUF4595 domain-containing protein [Alistipes sp.]